MAEQFESAAIAKLGWRQGSILGTKLAELACKNAPQNVAVGGTDLLILTSHDCDIVNSSIEKEPVVEVLSTSVAMPKRVDKQKSWGRNPRTLQLAVDVGNGPVVLSCTVHNRWPIPRSLLLQEAPAGCLPDKERRLVSEWLAKRYIRAAFPTAFDLRWRSKSKDWEELLKKHSEWLTGIYLRLSTLDELPDAKPYKCHIILAVPSSKRRGTEWAKKRDELEEEVKAFWEQFKPTIECAGVEPLGTDEISLEDIEPYQRFDADWVSFEDDTSPIPSKTDMMW